MMAQDRRDRFGLVIASVAFSAVIVAAGVVATQREPLARGGLPRGRQPERLCNRNRRRAWNGERIPSALAASGLRRLANLARRQRVDGFN
jgi:hypothetical protein